VLRRVPMLEEEAAARARRGNASAGCLTRADVDAFVRDHVWHAGSETAVRVTLALFDRDGNGEISLEELKAASASTASAGRGKKKMSTAQSLMLGSISGAVGSCVVFPIDKIKTRLQSAAAGDSRGMLTQARDVLRSEGLPRLYKGLSAELLMIGPVKAAALWSNDFFRTALGGGPGGKKLGPREEMLSGIGTGLIVTTFMCPQEIVKIRLQMQGMPGVPQQGLAEIVRELGVRGLYKGVDATALREVPFCVIYYTCYNWCKKQAPFIPRDPTSGLATNSGVFASGVIAGMLAAGLDTPADCIKTRLQNGQVQYKGIVDCAVRTWQADGYRPFLAGVLPRMLICGPKYGTILFVYEFLQRNLFPGEDPALSSIQEDIDAIRGGRVEGLVERAQARYGLGL
jgi:solute carrier family 25 (mitochondrial aspartate/glutamate transporter), member 12/13